MSRITIYQDKNLTLVGGHDPMLGGFLQLFDNRIETPEGESLIYDWCQKFGTDVNLTGISISSGKKPEEICEEYIKLNKDIDDNI